MIYFVLNDDTYREFSDIEGSESDTGENVEDTADSTENDEWVDVSEVDNIPSPMYFDISPRIAGPQISNDIKEPLDFFDYILLILWLIP